jgi:hypothetical protein
MPGYGAYMLRIPPVAQASFSVWNVELYGQTIRR